MTTLLGRFNEMVDAVLGPAPPEHGRDDRLTFIDLFCGIGGFHVAGANLGLDCVFASDIDAEARAVYQLKTFQTMRSHYLQ